MEEASVASNAIESGDFKHAGEKDGSKALLCSVERAQEFDKAQIIRGALR